MQKKGRRATVELASLVSVGYIAAYALAILKPHIAGLIGGVVYLLAKNDLGKTHRHVLLSIPIVSLFAFVGSWIVVEVLQPIYLTEWKSTSVRFLSGVAGFLSYDAVLLFTNGTESMLQIIAKEVGARFYKIYKLYKEIWK